MYIITVITDIYNTSNQQNINLNIWQLKSRSFFSVSYSDKCLVGDPHVLNRIFAQFFL